MLIMLAESRFLRRKLVRHPVDAGQGAFILAKAKNGPEIAGECLEHLRRYLQMLFNQPKQEEETNDAFHDHR
jgi:TetR/AcrR family transcriptional repressor of nem operon